MLDKQIYAASYPENYPDVELGSEFGAERQVPPLGGIVNWKNPPPALRQSQKSGRIGLGEAARNAS